MKVYKVPLTFGYPSPRFQMNAYRTNGSLVIVNRLL